MVLTLDTSSGRQGSHSGKAAELPNKVKTRFILHPDKSAPTPQTCAEKGQSTPTPQTCADKGHMPCATPPFSIVYTAELDARSSGSSHSLGLELTIAGSSPEAMPELAPDAPAASGTPVARSVSTLCDGETPREVRLITPRTNHSLYGRQYFDEKYQHDVESSVNFDQHVLELPRDNLSPARSTNGTTQVMIARSHRCPICA